MRDPYDRFTYPSLPRPQTHPAHLAAIAALYGMTAAPVNRCRVLEIGCGDSANLLPLACEFPGSRFFGVDRAVGPLAAGRDLADTLGLENLELRQADLAEWTPSGEFDYIIAHGVFSWTPPHIREKILAICGATLSPNGIAFVSYNALPGCFFRQYVWRFLRLGTRAEQDPARKVQLARELANSWMANLGPDAHQAAIREELKTLLERDAGAIFHDDLSDVNEPFDLSAFVELAGNSGLQYLGDAEPVRDEAGEIPADSEGWLQARQYGDYFAGRRFRETLLCRSEIKLDRAVSWDRLLPLFAASRAIPEPPASDGSQAFQLRADRKLTTNHPLAKELLCLLGSQWPASLPVSGLSRQDFPEAEAAELLRRLFVTEAVELRVQPPTLATSVSARPSVSSLVRSQLARGHKLVTNQRHQGIDLPEEEAQELVLLLDGTRDLAALRAALGERNGKASLETGLDGLLRLCLLTG